jgi:hypothetical protein
MYRIESFCCCGVSAKTPASDKINGLNMQALLDDRPKANGSGPD